MPDRVAPDKLASDLAAAPELEPFADDAVACCGALSRKLFELAAPGGHHELMALAHWLRPVSVLSMRRQFDHLSGGRAPRGLVFHLAPAGSDASAGYSLALSLLVGNRNIARIPPGAGEQADLLCRALDSVLADARFAPIRAGTAVARYEADPQLDEAFAHACEVRIAWGDAPLAIASAAAYLEGDGGERAEQLYWGKALGVDLVSELTRPAPARAAA
jgi:hypothetical protein